MHVKTIVIGDLHGYTTWKAIIAQEKDFDEIIFLADYFDSFSIPLEQQINNFLDILEYEKTSGKRIHKIIGNHDYHYFPEIHTDSTSGFQRLGKLQIAPIIDANRSTLKICHRLDNFLFTHAGISERFMNDTFRTGWHIDEVDKLLNELFFHKPQAFDFNGYNPYGDDPCQTPIWIRPRSLMFANRDSELKEKYIQVVGHTKVEKVDREGKSTGGRYYFLDCLGTSGEYMIITDGAISFNTVDNGQSNI